MMNKLLSFMDRYAMVSPGDRLLCAVSGGADSMAMLHLLLESRDALGIELCCAHYNHGIRGDEAMRDELFVKKACEALGISFVCGRGDVPTYAKENGMGTEEAARALRYEFLNESAEKLRCNKIATAHNLMDNAETMLLNLLRGSGARGMAGIAPVRGNIIRPILCLDRPEIETYLAEKGIEFITDSTNLSDDYTRNRLRHHVMEPLREMNPDFGAKFFAAGAALRADEEYLSGLAETFLEEQGEAVSAAALAALPSPVSVRVIMSLVPGASRQHIEAVLALAGSEKSHGELSLPSMRVLKQYDKLLFGAQKEEKPCETVLKAGKNVKYGKYFIKCSEGEASTHYFCFKIDEICGNILVSSRREGDKLRLSSRGVTKSLKKLFSESRVPPCERDGIPVIRDEKGVLAVYGYGQDCRAKAEPGGQALIINIEKCEEQI